MNATPNTFGIVIIGSGMAGYTLARELRKHDQGIPVTIVTADGGAMYSKPMLSNAMAQNKPLDTLVQKDAASAAQSLGVTVRAHQRVTRIDRLAHRIELETTDGTETLDYDKLVLATGATPRPYCVPGDEARPIATVNSLDDYRRWRAELNEGDKVLLVGAGLIGVEFANDLAIAGHEVSVVDPAPQPLGRLLPEALGGVVAQALTDTGVEILMRHIVTTIKPYDGRHVAVLDDEREVLFDKALSAIGLVPNTGLAADAGLTVEQGIKVGDTLATSDPDIFALGDCAQTRAGVLPFVLPLMGQARALAQTLAGAPTVLSLPALPVVVKTPALPVVVCPPAPGAEGQWHVDGTGRDLRAVFRDPAGRALGFALTGSHSKARQTLAKDMPDLIAV